VHAVDGAGIRQRRICEAEGVEVLGFLPSDQIDPVAWDRSYFLGVEEAGARPYRLLRTR